MISPSANCRQAELISPHLICFVKTTSHAGDYFHSVQLGVFFYLFTGMRTCAHGISLSCEIKSFHRSSVESLFAFTGIDSESSSHTFD